MGIENFWHNKMCQRRELAGTVGTAGGIINHEMREQEKCRTRRMRSGVEDFSRREPVKALELFLLLAGGEGRDEGGRCH